MAGKPGDRRQRSGGGVHSRRAGNRTIPLMFLGIIAVLTNPTKSSGNFNVLGYDCRNPSDIKVHDAEALCPQKT